MKSVRFNPLASLVTAVALTIGLAACGGSSKKPPEPTAEELAQQCRDAGGRPEADGTCTSAEDVAKEMAAAQRTAINTAITAARTAVAGLTDDASDAAIGSAESAVAAAKTAVSGAANIPSTEKAAFNTAITAIEGQLTAKKTSITAARDKAADDKMAADTKLGKAMYAALGPPAQENTTALNNIGVPTLAATSITIDATEGAGALVGTTDPAAVILKAGDSSGSLGSWMGTDYAHTDSTTKVANEAMVYANQGEGDTLTFAKAGYVVATSTSGSDIKDHIQVSNTTNLDRVKGADFTHSGKQNHTYDSDNEVAFYARGTYDGAPGQYRCTGTCSSTNDGKGSPSALTGTWHFDPDESAMVHRPDTDYLYFGWWVSKDKDGSPTAASAFHGMRGDVDGGDAGNQVTAGSSLSGTATYEGHAAGKFAMNNPLDGTSNGGHFTADAMLEATFGPNTGENAVEDSGMTGTIDNFRLNGGSEDPGWSVKLNKATWGSGGVFTSPADDNQTPADESLNTVWSVNDNAAAVSGTWSGQMYDEMPGDAPDGDGSNIPTTVTGTFYSEFSSIGRMVGAFGAEKTED